MAKLALLNRIADGAEGGDGITTVNLTPYFSMLFNCGAPSAGNYGDGTFQP
jgi:hypothetical protein